MVVVVGVVEVGEGEARHPLQQSQQRQKPPLEDIKARLTVHQIGKLERQLRLCGV